MIAAREYTSANVAEMRANAAAVRARCFQPKFRPKPRLVEAVVKPAPLPPPEVPSWKKTPTFFFAHIGAYRANLKIQQMIKEGEVDACNFDRRSISQIVDEVLLGFPGITVQAVKGRSRTFPVVAARHAAIYAVKMERPDMSYPAIGRWFGLDHTSILHCVRKIQAQRASA